MAFAIAACCCTPIAGAADLQTAVDQAILPIMREYDVPGIAVAVTVNGKPSYFSYGLASKEDHKPVSEHTLFELGSVSKTFTATMVTYGVAQGKLSLDDHPSRHMPQLKGSAIDQATMLNFGTYTAGGLPLQVPDEVKNTEASMLAFLRDFKPVAAPDQVRKYSNPSLGVFGHAASLAMKTSQADILEKRLLPKLGMRNTYIRVPRSAMSNYAWGYNKDNQPVRMRDELFSVEAYGVRSSSADLIRYVQANIDPSHLDDAVRRAIEGTHIGYFKTGVNTQGLGWERYPYPVSLEHLLEGNSNTMSREVNPTVRLSPPLPASNNTWYNKTGATGGFSSYVAFVPEKKIGIVILANRNYPIPERIKAAHAILSSLDN
ncbi:class C beta-lactamase [Duganella radicis]|uniref:Beta-lactamase n=1 Tax=Duganella radicis TaxID=551988 RepID=A0A6L6PHR5_9BURK|nr:class C beta-lactamase [Duganella radicis]